MRYDRRRIRYALAVAGLVVFTSSAARADAVLRWNATATTTLTSQTPPLNAFHQSRYASIVQLAVFEAVNAIEGDYESYLGSPAAPRAARIAAPPGASAEAAAITAAHDVLAYYFPGNAATLTAQRVADLAAIPAGQSKEDGILVGAAAAAALIALRVDDGASPATFHLPGATPPGTWNITPGCPVDSSGNHVGGTLLNWQHVTPFGVAEAASGDWTEAFRPAPPPAITSSRYAKDYNEVKALGGLTSTQRPDERALVALFYAAASPTAAFHSVARQLAEARGDSLAENARSLALVSIATADSLVASFAAKYHYRYWRPVTAIRGGAGDDNRKTEGDAAFTPFIVTPCFPSYPSNHASGSNGAAETLRRLYGAAGHAIALSTTVTGIGVVTLNYTSLQQICDDVDDARVYGGIHFRFDQEGGVRLGRDVAKHVYKNNLQRVGREPGN
jgi:hypothetical protein